MIYYKHSGLWKMHTCKLGRFGCITVAEGQWLLG